jgi:hypothetical protein
LDFCFIEDIALRCKRYLCQKSSKRMEKRA